VIFLSPDGARSSLAFQKKNEAAQMRLLILFKKSIYLLIKSGGRACSTIRYVMHRLPEWLIIVN